MFEAMVYLLRVGVSLARSAGTLWFLEFGLYSLAAMVARRTLGQVVASAGPRRAMEVEVLGCQPYQGSSRCEQSSRRSAKSSHWSHQRRSEHQTECMGGWSRTSDQRELGSGTASRCHCRPNIIPPEIARHDHRGRQGIRQRRFSERITALWKPSLYSAATQPTAASKLASRLLQEAPPSRKSISAFETLSESGNAL
jgi:hypothetical protein